MERASPSKTLIGVGGKLGAPPIPGSLTLVLFIAILYISYCHRAVRYSKQRTNYTCLPSTTATQQATVKVPRTLKMVLADLGARLHGALNQLSKASVIDDKVGRFTVDF
jgi:hypothetical protein